MSINDISNINNKALTKIKQDTYNELKDIYTKKYKDININNRKRLYDGLYMEYNALKSIPIMKENIDDIIKNNKLDTQKYPYIQYCLNILLEIKDNIKYSKEDVYTYPDYNNENFEKDITNRFEYDIPITNTKEGCDSNSFKLAPYQIFLKNYISGDTPYNGILIYHGTGTGKTCTAISIAENFRDIYHRKSEKIIILSSGGVKQGWLNNIYNPKKDIEQCTGDTFTNLKKNKENAELMQKQLIKKYYEFHGYLEFANRIRDIYDDECIVDDGNGNTINIPIYKLKVINGNDIIQVGSLVKWNTKEKRENRGKVINIKNKSHNFKKICDRIYSNRVLIIDEVHNIRGDGQDKSDDNIKYIRLLLDNTKNLKLILLSATPVYNRADEITELLKLLLANDNRVDNLDNIFKNGKLIDEKLLIEKVKGYVSYIKVGKNDKFPDKLYPKENIYKLNDTSKLKIYGCPILKDTIQYKKYIETYDILMRNDKELQLKDEKKLMQLSNITYPSKSKDISKYYGSDGLKEIFTISDRKYKYRTKEKIFDMKNIHKYSSKIDALLKKLETSEGVVFIYSQYIQSGIIPIMLALEQNGYSNYSGNDILDEQVVKNNFKYISITADKDISTNNDKEIKDCISPDNANGEKIKIILGSNVASEGLDLKYIREIHIFDPWYHLKKIDQIVGRGIRFCSHMELPIDKRNTTIYMYASTIPNNNEKSIDLRIYDIAEKKNNEIVKVEKILQENAVDKDIFKDMNDNKPRKNIKCIKTLKKNMNSLTNNSLKNMYNVYEKIIKECFKNKISYNIEELTENICNILTNDNINEDLIYLTLRNMIKYKNTIEYHNRKGYIIYINGNYIYQPLTQKDNFVSIYRRENDEKTNKYNKLTFPKSKKSIKKDKPNIDDVLNKLVKEKDKISNDTDFNKISNFTENIQYDFAIERLNVLEKQSLIEGLIEDKLPDLTDIVYEHFKTNLIYKDYQFNKPISEKPIGYILFIKNKKKGIKKDEKDIPMFILGTNREYNEAEGVAKHKIIENFKKTVIVYPKYYSYNYIDKQDNNIMKVSTMTTERMCPTSNQSKVDKKEFKDNYPDLYEQSKDIFDRYNESNIEDTITQKTYCNLIEILLRIKSNKEIKYHFDYDNYFLNKFDI